MGLKKASILYWGIPYTYLDEDRDKGILDIQELSSDDLKGYNFKGYIRSRNIFSDRGYKIISVPFFEEIKAKLENAQKNKELQPEFIVFIEGIKFFNLNRPGSSILADAGLIEKFGSNGEVVVDTYGMTKQIFENPGLFLKEIYKSRVEEVSELTEIVSSFDKMPKIIMGLRQLKRFDKKIIDQHIEEYNFELYCLAKQHPHLIMVEDFHDSRGNAFDSTNLEDSLIYLNGIKDIPNVQRFGSSYKIPYNKDHFTNLHVN